MTTSHEIAEGIRYFPGTYEMPGLGNLPVNFFLIQGTRKTMLVDTGAPPKAKQALDAIRQVIDPAKIDYVFLTHMDVDHYGGLSEILKVAPQARLVGNLTNMLKGSMWEGFAPPKFAVVWPGQEIDLGGRSVRVEPAVIEDTFTYWLSDTKTRTFFSSDAFGAIQFGPPAEFADEAPPGPYSAGFTLWHQVNFTHIPMINTARYVQGFDALKAADVQQIASVHGPVIRRNVKEMIDLVRGVPAAAPPAPPPLPAIFNL